MTTDFERWLGDLNTTSYKAVWTVWLWIASFVFIALYVLLISVKAMQPALITESLYMDWLLFLGAISGVQAAEFFGKRKTDVNAIAAANPASSTAIASSPGSTAVAQSPGGPVSQPAAVLAPAPSAIAGASAPASTAPTAVGSSSGKAYGGDDD